jgi:hypothetical protein
MEHVNIMLPRVAEQLGALPQLKLTRTVKVTAQAIPLESALMESGETPMKLEEQVQMVADRATEMIKLQFVDKTRLIPKGDS